MDKEQESKVKPIFKPWTPEKEAEFLKEMDEACKKASEKLRKINEPKLEP